MKYVLIYKNDKKNLNYYYNFQDNLVYTSNNKENSCSFMGMIGIILGFIIYLTLGIISYYVPYSYLFIIILGIIFGTIITLIANSTIKDVFFWNGKSLSITKLREMYRLNKAFRVKYLLLMIAFFFLTLLSLGLYQNTIPINFVYLTSVIMTTFLILLYRPVNSFKFRKLLEKKYWQTFVLSDKFN